MESIPLTLRATCPRRIEKGLVRTTPRARRSTSVSQNPLLRSNLSHSDNCNGTKKMKERKTYNTRDLLAITDPTTDQAVSSLLALIASYERLLYFRAEAIAIIISRRYPRNIILGLDATRVLHECRLGADMRFRIRSIRLYYRWFILGYITPIVIINVHGKRGHTVTGPEVTCQKSRRRLCNLILVNLEREIHMRRALVDRARGDDVDIWPLACQ